MINHTSLSYKKPPSPRAIWKGRVSFGLINIPVRLVPAWRRADVPLHFLHKSDNSRIEEKFICQAEHKEIARRDLVKGLEIEPGRHLIIDSGELQSLLPQSNKNMSILYFTKAAEIDAHFYRQPFYLLPQKKGEEPYLLLLKALERTETVAVSKLNIHHKGYVGVIRPLEDILSFQTLRHLNELIPVEAVQDHPMHQKVEEREIEAACELVDSLTSPFQPESLRNDYRDALAELLQRKLENEIHLYAAGRKGDERWKKNLLLKLEASLIGLKRLPPASPHSAHPPFPHH